MSTLGEKLTQLRKEKGMSRVDFAKKIGLPHTTLRNYETDVREPGHLFLIKMAKEFKVSVDYLLSIDVLANEEIKEKTKFLNVDISNGDRALLKKYHALDPHGKDMVDTVLTKEYERTQQQIQIIEQRKNKVSFEILPCSTYSASAGTGIPLFDDIDNYDVKVISNETTKKADLIIHIRGNSMEPAFFNDDYVAIKYQPTVDIGDIGVFVLNGEAYIKELGTNGLISLNEKYADKLFEDYDSVHCAGRVLGTVEICD